MKTVIGLFDQREEAMRAYSALLSDGYARADLDILTNDDRDDEPKLARMHSWVPEPDCSVYLAGVQDGGTLVTANVADSAASRAASILGSYDMVNISDRAGDLSRKARSSSTQRTTGIAKSAVTGAASGAAAAAGRTAKGAADVARKGASALTEPIRQTPAAPTQKQAAPQEVGLTDPATSDNCLEVIEEDMEVGKEQVERGRMRMYNVVTEHEVAQNVPLRDETLRVQRRPVNRAVNIDQDIFKPHSFEMVEMDEIAKVKKTARVVEEVSLGKEVAEKVETIKQTLRRQDVKVEEVPAARPFESYQNDFRGFYDKNLANSGVSYESLQPSLKFGHSLATREPFRSSPWPAVEADARRIWEDKNPGSWEANRPMVKYAWEAVRHAR